MQVPLTVSFLGTPVDEVIRTACWNEAEKLERYYDRITSCHVTVEPGKRKRKGNHLEVHVRLSVPGGEIVASNAPPNHDADEKAHLVVRATFDEVRRRLQDFARRQRGEEKRRAQPPAVGP